MLHIYFAYSRKPLFRLKFAQVTLYRMAVTILKTLIQLDYSS